MSAILEIWQFLNGIAFPRNGPKILSIVEVKFSFRDIFDRFTFVRCRVLNLDKLNPWPVKTKEVADSAFLMKLPTSKENFSLMVRVLHSRKFLPGMLWLHVCRD